MEATDGFEPSNRDFADLRLRPLGYVAQFRHIISDDAQYCKRRCASSYEVLSRNKTRIDHTVFVREVIAR